MEFPSDTKIEKFELSLVFVVWGRDSSFRNSAKLAPLWSVVLRVAMRFTVCVDLFQIDGESG